MPTFDFNPSVADLVLSAYARIGLRRTALVAEHMIDARQECNLLQSEWSNQQVNLFTIDLQALPLVEGQATYVLPTETITMLDTYISQFDSEGNSQDHVIYPVSRTEYASYPNKAEQGRTTVFWFDRLGSPTVSLWMVPDENGPYVLRFYRARQIGDAVLQGGGLPDIPYRWADAWIAGLAARLARIHAPDRLQDSQAEALRAWTIAATADVEAVPLRIIPGTAGYFR